MAKYILEEMVAKQTPHRGGPVLQDPIVKRMEKIRSGWLRTFLQKSTQELDVELEDVDRQGREIDLEYELYFNG